MHRTTSPRVKICCIRSVEEAWTAIRTGASALGLVSEMPSGPGVISEDLIREIAAAIPPPIASFLLTSREDAEEIIDQQRRCATNTLQLCDRLKFGSHRDLRRALPGIAIVQVVHVTGERSIDEAFRISHEVDAILLDSGNPQLPTKELGGTGRLHDWDLSSRIRAAVDVPVFLAGGLDAGNAAEAVRRVGPFGIDLCSGLRTEGMLDEGKVQALFQALGRS